MWMVLIMINMVVAVVPCRERVGAKIRVKVFIVLSLVTRWPGPRPLVHCYCPQGLDHDDDDNDDADIHNHDNGGGSNAYHVPLRLVIVLLNQYWWWHWFSLYQNVYCESDPTNNFDILPHCGFEKNRGYWTTMIRVITWQWRRGPGRLTQRHCLCGGTRAGLD